MMMKGFTFTASSFALVAILIVSAAYLLNARETIESGRVNAARIMLVASSFNNFAGIAALYPQNIFTDSLLDEASIARNCPDSAKVSTRVKNYLASAALRFQTELGVKATASNVQVAVTSQQQPSPGTCTQKVTLSFSLDVNDGAKTGTVVSKKTIQVSSGAFTVKDDFFNRQDY